MVDEIPPPLNIPLGWEEVVRFISDKFARFDDRQEENRRRLIVLEEAQHYTQNVVEEAQMFIRNVKFDSHRADELDTKITRLADTVLPIFKSEIAAMVGYVARDIDDFDEWRGQFLAELRRKEDKAREVAEQRAKEVATITISKLDNRTKILLALIGLAQFVAGLLLAKLLGGM